MPPTRCPRCGKFMAYDAYYARWQCKDDWCGTTVTPEKAPPPSREELRRGQERIRRALASLIDDGQTKGGELMVVQHGGESYEVTFEYQWHNPPRPGSVIHPGATEPEPRLRQTTRCTITLADGTSVAAETHCSVVDRYNFMDGNRKALERAVGLLPIPPEGDLDRLDVRERAFKQQVLPELVKDPRARTRRPVLPGRRRLLREANELRQRLKFIELVAQQGITAALNHTWVTLADGTAETAGMLIQEAGMERIVRNFEEKGRTETEAAAASESAAAAANTE